MGMCTESQSALEEGDAMSLERATAEDLKVVRENGSGGTLGSVTGTRAQALRIR